MSSEIIQVLVLAAIALFLVLRLRSVLGTRGGFENPDAGKQAGPAPYQAPKRPNFDVVEGGDADIAAYAEPGSPLSETLVAMKRLEPGFNVGQFVDGAKQAYEMIVMGYETGDMSQVERFLAPDVLEGFNAAIAERKAQGMTVDARFIGVRNARLSGASLDPTSGLGEVTVEFTGELYIVVRDAEGRIVEGDENELRRQVDVFTFERTFGQSDPNWILVATGE